jgi:dipeptidyl aminopeptidase/acylaminoacyl peptidase
LAVVDTKGKQWPGKLASNADFFMHPAWHPSGQWLAWIAWDHPHMPWDETRLVLGKLDQAEGHKLYLLEQQALIDQGDVAIAEPHFTSDGRYLLYLSDASGWPNLYRYDLQTQEHIQITKEKAEIGGPAWTQAQRHYVYDAKNQRIIYLRNRSGQTSLWHVSLQGGNPQPLVTPMASYTDMSQPTLSPNSTQLALIASASDIPPRVVSTHLDDSAGPRIHAFSTAERVQSAIYSRPESIAWEAENGDTVHGLFYPPHNPGYEGRGAPPLLVMVHGGPTGQSTTAYQGRTQFFTSRGFAVLDVNYRGSTGYGKEYMKKLRGNWGIYDVADVVSGAEYVVSEGRADGARMVIMGGSAGGFTVLLALAQHPGFFKAGICSYGVSNLFTLAADTHKFEAHYLDSMVGPLPEAAERYRERSAYFLADQIQDPLAVFQGEEDRVVPKEQSDSIVETLRRRGVPHTYHVYAGEGHGWRKSETISDYYEAIMRFLRQYVIFG